MSIPTAGELIDDNINKKAQNYRVFFIYQIILRKECGFRGFDRLPFYILFFMLD